MTVIDTTIADKAPTAAKPVRQRLIDAAEQLFAEHGWNGVSIRTIANAADVSLAALNYHFGEKENLLAEIFAARARPIAEKRMRLLTEVNANPSATLEDVIEAFLRPALATGAENRMFARLRARLATEPEAFSRRILSDAFDESSRLCIEGLRQRLPSLPEEALYWRFHFLMGTMVYTMADSGRIQSLTNGSCDPGDVDAALRHIVPFLAAGFRAETPVAPARPRTSLRRTKK
jgi:AcrR family transcriptional regulator